MTVTIDDKLETYVEHVRRLPFVKKAEIRELQRWAGPHRPDAVLRLNALRGRVEFFVEVKRTHLTYAIADGFIARTGKNTGKPWILFAPYVGRKMGQYLAEHGVNYIDDAGNCRLHIGQNHIAVIEGRQPMRRPERGRGIGAPGYQVLFAILARRDLLNVPVRTLADAAGAGKTATAELLARLKKEGLIGTDLERRHLLDAGTLLDRWLTGYATAVRPRLLVGRYRTPDPNPEALEGRIEEALRDTRTWAWGGAAAAMRLTGRYRGEQTIIHVQGQVADLPARLKALPAEEGPLTILRVPGRIALEGVAPKTAHPLLIYTELMTAADARAREAALGIREQYLEPWA